MNKIFVALAYAVLTLVCTPATAALIFDNGDSAGRDGGWSDFDQGQEIADDFTLGAGRNSVSAISWSGSYYDTNTPTAADDFTFNFYTADLGLTPFLSIHIADEASRVDSGIDNTLFGLDVYDYFATIPAITLLPNETYFLSIVNNTVNDSDDWLWDVSNPVAGNGRFRPGPGDPWITVRSELTFKLYGEPVALPSTASLFILGILALARRK